LRKFNSYDARLFPGTRNAMKLLLITLLRPSEVVEAPWKEIDFQKRVWTIPISRMKNKTEHKIPLSEQAYQILSDQYERTGNCEFFFPNQENPHKPMSKNAVLKAIERLGYKGRHSAHGYRSLGTGIAMEKLNWRFEVVDRQLSPLPGGSRR